MRSRLSEIDFSGVSKSGTRMKANRIATIQNRWLWVKSAIRHRSAMTPDCTWFALWAILSGRECRLK